MASKILFILHIPPPINGAALVGKYIQDSEIINTRFETKYVNLTASFSLEKIGKGGIGKFKHIFSIIRNVFRKLKNSKYDLCYMTLTAKGPGFYKDFLIILLVKLFKVNIVYHFHNKGVALSSKKWYNAILYKYAFNNTKCILLAPSLYKDIERYVSAENVYFCPNGIPEYSTFNTFKELEKIETLEPCKFLFLSNMLRQKGVLELLKACYILHKQRLKFECHFIGAWADIQEEEFNSAIEKYKLQHVVTFHGKQYGQDKVSFFEKSDVFVFPTFYHNECFPLVLLEAMQFGLPIITTDEGAIGEIVQNNKTGIIVKQQDVDSLAEAMLKMLKEPDIRKEYGARGKKRFEENFTLSMFEKKMEAILIKALNK
ncbi:glycosyltransferase family 4 protein [Hyunsoonleella pacifica]|uniref:Glycosyltransferase n=1 Tax=Hyunsoonleella pacifica TaxID=1080224 RepID=A0A4Q9FW38_9FLAO|nr:glycosyltransferase family 4 protein [Hyunsoonleella pacifica]TBN18652.1 glycosyltransferase [Hyunsoonleella pacifica]GGD03559.1 glycosyl transferase [Hyunsoonleella pacifica]